MTTKGIDNRCSGRHSGDMENKEQGYRDNASGSMCVTWSEEPSKHLVEGTY